MTGANGAPSETRTYNSIGQLTQLQSGSLNIQYDYSATQNNGKITSETDVVSGEQIAYTYDSLNRLASATSSVNPGWGQSYAYDGFGNLTDPDRNQRNGAQLERQLRSGHQPADGGMRRRQREHQSASACYVHQRELLRCGEPDGAATAGLWLGPTPTRRATSGCGAGVWSG